MTGLLAYPKIAEECYLLFLFSPKTTKTSQNPIGAPKGSVPSGAPFFTFFCSKKKIDFGLEVHIYFAAQSRRVLRKKCTPFLFLLS